ncbi:MAG: YwqG family protein [Pseudomonadota bacterium]
MGIISLIVIIATIFFVRRLRRRRAQALKEIRKIGPSLVTTAGRDPTVFHEEDKAFDIAARKVPRPLEEVVKLAYNLAAPAVLCHVSVSDISTGLLDSRLGGWPAWPKGKDLPKDPAGRPLVFLAQINLDDCPRLPDFPTTGLLQFFIGGGPDDTFGLYSEETDEPVFQVIHHEDTDGLHMQNPYAGFDISELDTPFEEVAASEEEEAAKFEGLYQTGLELTFEAAYLPADISDNRISSDLWSRYQDALAALSQEEAEEIKQVEHLALHAPHEKANFNVGGHPRFVQGDIRQSDDLPPGSPCLMAVGSLDDIIMWGDLGQACFLIPKDDLVQKRFDRAVYHWDCA